MYIAGTVQLEPSSPVRLARPLRLVVVGPGSAIPIGVRRVACGKRLGLKPADAATVSSSSKRRGIPERPPDMTAPSDD